ncbi:MAG: hypothetical protein MMC33_000585 [Icmadophila ericetorum]|nr:hypothetical protein [Icmadophila ericetorum]
MEEGLTEPISTRKVHGFKWFLVIVGIISSLSLYALDTTITANVTPSIFAEFGHIYDLSWLSVGFTLGGMCTLLPLGKLYDIFNPKWLYVFAGLLFLGAAALEGAAPNMNALIVGRILSGLGGNGLYLGSATLIALNTTDRERPFYLSFLGITWGAGTVVGPILGGAFVKITWRWAFFFSLCVGGALLPVWLFLLPSTDPQPGKTYKARLKNFDVLGTILVIGATTTLTLAINFGGNLWPWKGGQSIALFTIAGICMALFVLQQVYKLGTDHNNQLFPIHLLGNKDAVLLFIISAACDGAAFVPIYYIPLFFQFTRGDSAIVSSFKCLPYIVTEVALILGNGFFMSYLGHWRPWYIGGSALALVGGICMSLSTPSTPVAHIYGFEILMGLGAGAYIQASFPVMIAMVDPENTAFASSWIMFAQLCGDNITLAIASAVFTSRSFTSVSALLPNYPATDIQTAVAGFSGSFFQHLPIDVRGKVLDIVVSSLDTVFILFSVSNGLCLILSFFLSRRDLFKDELTSTSTTDELASAERIVNTLDEK